MLGSVDGGKLPYPSYGIRFTRLQTFAVFRRPLDDSSHRKSLMRFTNAELASIDERASTLSERLSGRFLPISGDAAVAARRLSRWRELAGEDQPRQLAALLKISESASLPDPDLLSFLGPVRRVPGTSLPDWVVFLNEIIESVTVSFAAASIRHRSTWNVFGRKLRNIPFVHLYWPMAEFAWSRGFVDSAASTQRLDAQARRGLQAHLVRRLSGIVSSILEPAFFAYLSSTESGIMREFFGSETLRDEGQKANSRYLDFIREQGESGLHSLFLRYPVAGRLVSETTQQWIDFVREFLQRLSADQDLIADQLNSGRSIGQLRFVQAGVSDPHRKGRSVLLLRFDTGLRCVYKPRSALIDEAFYGLVEELNNLDPEPGLRALKICGRREYGWIEFASHGACPNRRAAQRFYRRAGSLSSLLHWLQGLDFHRENVIAAGEHPVLVDLEGLAHPVRLGELMTTGIQPPWSLAGSVIRPGLLPVWQTRFAGSGLYDNSGLGAPIKQRGMFPTRCWRDVNTDQMRSDARGRFAFHRAHRPRLHGRTLAPQAFTDEVMAGYRQTTALLQGIHAPVFAKWRRLIFATTRRHLKRSTVVYRLLLSRSVLPDNLAAGIDRSIELLALPCAQGDENDWLSEIMSLESLDVPYFQNEGETGDSTPSSVMPKPGCNGIQSCLVRLSLRRKLKLSEGQIHELGHTAKAPVDGPSSHYSGTSSQVGSVQTVDQRIRSLI